MDIVDFIHAQYQHVWISISSNHYCAWASAHRAAPGLCGLFQSCYFLSSVELYEILSENILNYVGVQTPFALMPNIHNVLTPVIQQKYLSCSFLFSWWLNRLLKWNHPKLLRLIPFFIISLVALHSCLEPNKTIATRQKCQSGRKRRYSITLTHHPFHNHPKVISGLGQRSQVVQMKRASMKRGGHFPEKPNWLLQTRGMTEMKLAHLNPFLGGRGEWRDEKEGESVTETGRERRKKTNETMKEKKGSGVGAGAGSGPAERNRDDRRVRERKRWYYRDRGWKTELSLRVIHGLILTIGVIKPSARVISILP